MGMNQVSQLLIVLLQSTALLVSADHYTCTTPTGDQYYCDASEAYCCREYERACCLKDYDGGYIYQKWYFWVGIGVFHLIAVILLACRIYLRRTASAGFRFRRLNEGNSSLRANNCRNAASLAPLESRQDAFINLSAPPPSYEVAVSPPAPKPVNEEEAAKTVEAIVMFG